MDSERISEILRFHGNRVTWESHVAMVETMTKWSLEELRDYQGTLMQHVVDETFVITAQNLVITHPDGSESDAGNREQSLKNSPRFGSNPEWAWLVAHNDFLNAWRPDPIVEVSVRSGLIGLPIHPWSATIWERRRDTDQPAEKIRAARTRDLFHYVSHERWGHPDDLRMILRAAPWAMKRISGARLPGFQADRHEELVDSSGQQFLVSVCNNVRKGDDDAELVSFTLAPSAEFAVQEVARYLSTFPRQVGGRLLKNPRIGRIEPWVEGSVRSDVGRLLLDCASMKGPRGSALVEEVIGAIFTSAQPAGKHPRMSDAIFWRFISTLGRSPDDAAMDALELQLSAKPKKVLRAFLETLADKLHSLDLPSLVESETNGGLEMSDDAFLIVRCSIVAAGKAEVDRVLREGIIREAEWPEDSAERLLFVADEACELSFESELDHVTAVSWETGRNPAWGKSGVGDARASDGESAEIRCGSVGLSIRSASLKGEELVYSIRYWPGNDVSAASIEHDRLERDRLGEGAYRGIADTFTVPGRDVQSDNVLLSNIYFVG